MKDVMPWIVRDGMANNSHCTLGVLLHSTRTMQAFLDVHPDFTRWNSPHRNTLASHIYTTKNAWKSDLRTLTYKNTKFAHGARTVQATPPLATKIRSHMDNLSLPWTCDAASSISTPCYLNASCAVVSNSSITTI